MNSIAETISTARTQRGPHRPFGTTNMHKTKAKPANYANPDDLEICDDPIPAARAKPGNKYDEKFASLKLGQGMKVAPEHVSKVGNSLRKWIADKELDAHVRTVSIYPGDTKGRVWLMAGPQDAATAPGKRAHH